MKAIKPGQKIKPATFKNPEKLSLTVEQFLQFPGCEKYASYEAQRIVQSLHSLASMFAELHRQKTIIIDNQLVVNLNKDKKSAKIISLNAKSKAA